MTSILDFIFFPFTLVPDSMIFPTFIFLAGIYGIFAFEGSLRYVCIYMCGGGVYLLINFVLGVS